MSEPEGSTGSHSKSCYDSEVFSCGEEYKPDIREVGAGDVRTGDVCTDKRHTNVNLSKSKKANTCGKCGKTYSKPQYVRDHTMTVHQRSKANYSCRVCGQTFSWRVTLLKHIKRSHPEKNSSLMIEILF